MAASTDVQVVPGTGVEVEQPVVEACDDGGSVSATTTSTKLQSVKVLQEKPAVEACDDDGGRSGSATTTTEESVKVLQEQHHDTAPDPDHHEAATPEHATEVSAAWNEPEKEEKPAPVAKEDEVGEQQKAPPAGGGDDQESTRERLKRHRQEMAGRVWVPEKWGQEKLLKDWVDSAVFDRPLVPAGLLTARRALVAESFTRRPDRASTVSSAGSSPLRVRNGCST